MGLSKNGACTTLVMQASLFFRTALSSDYSATRRQISMMVRMAFSIEGIGTYS